jgi:hypothetical protein
MYANDAAPANMPIGPAIEAMTAPLKPLIIPKQLPPEMTSNFLLVNLFIFVV